MMLKHVEAIEQYIFIYQMCIYLREEWIFLASDTLECGMQRTDVALGYG